VLADEGGGMSELAKRLGRRIYDFRKQSGLTQAALAEKAKISNEFMSAVERGAKLPSLQVLERIAGGLRVDLKDPVQLRRHGLSKTGTAVSGNTGRRLASAEASRRAAT